MKRIMIHYTFIILISTIPLFTLAQTGDSSESFGLTINSSINGEIYPFRIVPSLTYSKRKSQIELGFGMHPFIRKDQKIRSGEFNFKHYPNGTNNKFNLYFITRLSYVKNRLNTYYSTTYTYLFLNGGYGFEIKPIEAAYLGTNVSVGTFTYNKDTENPYNTFAPKKLFKEFGFDLAFQFNFGYRF